MKAIRIILFRVSVVLSVALSGCSKKKEREHEAGAVSVSTSAPASALPHITPRWSKPGYGETWPKDIVLQIGGDIEPLTYHVAARDGSVVATGVVHAARDETGGSALASIDLHRVNGPGEYTLALSSAGSLATAISIRVVSNLVETLVDSQIAFLRASRCGEVCHRETSVAGGYHDSTADYSSRMSTAAWVVWSLSRYVEKYPGSPLALQELQRAVEWCLRMQAEDGSVYAAVVSEAAAGDVLPRAWEDKRKRTVDITYSPADTALFAAALGRAAPILRERVDRQHGLKVLTAAERAFIRLSHDSILTKEALGARLFAAAELFVSTKDPVFAYSARDDIRSLLSRTNGFEDVAGVMGLLVVQESVDESDPLQKSAGKTLDSFISGAAQRAGISPYHLAGTKTAGASAMALLLGRRSAASGDAIMRALALRQVTYLLGVNAEGFCAVAGIVEEPGRDAIRGGIYDAGEALLILSAYLLGALSEL